MCSKHSLVIAFCAILFAIIDAGPAVAGEGADALDLASHEGQVVVVDFWASWCVPCRRSFPWLNAMHRKYSSDGLVIIGINLDQERSEAELFLDEFPAEFRIYFDETKDVAREFGVVAMPSSYLVGRDGNVVDRHYGFKTRQQDEYEAAIVAALNDQE